MSIAYDLLGERRRSVVGDVGLRLDVAAVGRDAVAAAAARGAVPAEQLQPAAAARQPGPGEEAPQHPPEHLPALLHEPLLLLPCGGSHRGFFSDPPAGIEVRAPASCGHDDDGVHREWTVE